MRKMTLLFFVAFVTLEKSSFAQEGADRIKALEEKVQMLMNQLGLDKEDSVATPEQPKLPFNQKYEQKLEQIKSKIPFEVSGSVDVYIQTNFIGNISNLVANRVFVPKANSFELGMINLMLKKRVKKVGFCADLGFGPRAEAANNTLYSNTILAIKQLYVTYAPTHWLEFTLGNFSTFFGYEYIEPQNNFNYSTSLAFQNGPFYHTGFKANFTVKKWNFLAGFFDDTDHKSDSRRNKFVGAQVGYTNENGGVYLNFVGGNVPATYKINDSTVAEVYRNYKNAYDLTGFITLGKKKNGKIGVNLAYHQFRYKEQKADTPQHNKYFTSYLYAQYAISERASIGIRTGYLYNPDALVIGSSKHFADLTITAHINISGGLKLIPEYRLDYSSDRMFLDRKGGISRFQNTLCLAAVFAF
ncbi:MAG: outer membrane beta-barrel protein [Chitinophagales bacterium]